MDAKERTAMGKVEDVILRHSQRGMTTLKAYLDEDYCAQAADALLALPKGTVILTTGFYVAGYAETDGPLGTVYLAKALNALGYHAVILTDAFCQGFFEPEQVEVVYAPIDAPKTYYQDLLKQYQPAACIAIERCGENVQGDYANMRGVSIAEHTARIDELFELAKEQHIPTFGVGDGGNEIGMGNLKEVISEKLSLVPCRTCVDHLIIATVSNWGAYGLTACLEAKTGKKVFPSYPEVAKYLESIVALDSVDGVKKEHICTVDGFSAEIEKEIVEGLENLLQV